MKNLYLIVLATMALMACHESIEDRAARETADFTKKNCPAPVSENVINDSVSFDRDTRTVTYYYSLSGKLDTTAIDRDKMHGEMVKVVQDAPSLRAYKDAGFNFSYKYYSSKNKGKMLLSVTVGPGDYKRK